MENSRHLMGAPLPPTCQFTPALTYMYGPSETATCLDGAPCWRVNQYKSIEEI